MRIFKSPVRVREVENNFWIKSSNIPNDMENIIKPIINRNKAGNNSFINHKSKIGIIVLIWLNLFFINIKLNP